MFESAAPLRTEFGELETALADPAVHADLARARKVGRRYAELIPIVKALDEYDRISDDLAAARELAEEDASLAAEAVELEAQLEPITETLIWLRRLDGDPAQAWFRDRLRTQAANLVATP